MQLPVLNLPLSAFGQLDLHVQLSLTHHQVQIHTTFHHFLEISHILHKKYILIQHFKVLGHHYQVKKNSINVL